MTIKGLIERVAEDFRDEAERLEAETVKEIFECYWYGSQEINEEFDSYFAELEKENLIYIDYETNGTEVIVSCETKERITRRKFISAVKRYKF